jgi:hypothetical protein
VNSPRFVRQISTSLRPVLGEERIVQGAQVVSGPSPYGLFWVTTASSMVGGLATTQMAVQGWPYGALWGWALWGWALPQLLVLVPGLITLSLQKPTFIAVTSEQLICCRLTAFRKRPKHISATPLSGALLTDYRQRRWTTSLRCQLPGMDPVRLNATKGRRADLAYVLGAAHAAGALITGPDSLHEKAGNRWAIAAAP